MKTSGIDNDILCLASEFSIIYPRHSYLSDCLHLACFIQKFSVCQPVFSVILGPN
jgi:hypothetical protein